MKLNTSSEIFAHSSLAQESEQAEDAIRKNPSDVFLRMGYFQLLLVTGQWERALKQLQVLNKLNKELSTFAVVYGDLIRAEHQREKVFQGLVQPHFLRNPPTWVMGLLDALKTQTQNDSVQSDQLRLKAFAQIPNHTCTIKVSHSDIHQQSLFFTDMDSRLGAVMELMQHSRYFWVPMNEIASIEFTPLQDLRDIIWRLVDITLSNGEQLNAFVPARYPMSHLSEDDAIRLNKLTTWNDVGETGLVGLGQKMWFGDSGEWAINHLDSLTFSTQN